MKNNISSNIMDHSNLKNLTKEELINIIKNLTTKGDTKPGRRRPIPLPRRSVRQMVQDYEQQAVPVASLRTKRPVAAPRTKIPVAAPSSSKKPIPTPRTVIEPTAKALKGYTHSYEISIKNNKDPLVQLQNTRKAMAIHIENMLASMKGIKFLETLRVTFEKTTGREERIIKTAYFNSQPQTVTNEAQIEPALTLAAQEILNIIAIWISEGSGWTIMAVENHFLNLVKYVPMKGSSYIQLPHELRNSAKGLLNIKNEDNECFRWCHIRHLNPQDKNPQRIKKTDKAFVKNLNYQGIEFPVSAKE